jgi:hypothetical protein
MTIALSPAVTVTSVDIVTAALVSGVGVGVVAGAGLAEAPAAVA